MADSNKGSIITGAILIIVIAFFFTGNVCLCAK